MFPNYGVYGQPPAAPFGVPAQAAISSVPLIQTPAAPPPYPSMFPLPGGQMGQLLGMYLQPMIQNLFRQYGLQPMPLFSQMNMFNQWQSQQFYYNLMQASRFSGLEDRRAILDLLTGVRRAMLGRELTDNELNQLRRVAGQLQSQIPMIAGFVGESPLDLLLAAQGGSASMLSRGLMLGMRGHVSPFRPGRFGYSAEYVGSLAATLSQGIFGDGEGFLRTGGLGQASVGTLLNVMSARGYVHAARGQVLARAASLSDEELAAIAQRMATVQGRSEAAGDILNRLKATRDAINRGSPEAAQMFGFDELMGAGHGALIQRRVENLSRVVGAMKDLFGAAGRPAGKVEELIKGLEQVTQGALAQMDASQVEMLVRRAGALVANANISFEGLVQLTMEARAIGDRLGLNPVLAPIIAQQTAMNMVALGSMGAYSTPEFGVRGGEALSRQYSRTLARGMASSAGNVLGALYRLGKSGVLREGTALHRAYQNLLAGRAEGIPKTVEDLLEMARGEVDPGVLQAVLADRTANQQVFADLPGQASRVVEEMQAGQMQEIVARWGVGSGILRGKVADRDIQNVISQAWQAAIRDPSATAEQRMAAIKAVLRQAGVRDEEQLNQMALGLHAEFNRFSQENFRYSLGEVARLFSPEARRHRQQVRETTEKYATWQKEMAGLGAGGLAARIIRAIAQYKPGDDPMKTVLKGLGGLPAGLTAGLRAAIEISQAAPESQLKDWQSVLKGLTLGGEHAASGLGRLAELSGIEGATAENLIESLKQELGKEGLSAARKKRLQRLLTIAKSLKEAETNEDVRKALREANEKAEEEGEGGEEEGGGKGKGKGVASKVTIEGPIQLAGTLRIIEGEDGEANGKVDATGSNAGSTA